MNSKFVAFFKTSLKKSLQYRARAFIWLFWDTAPPLIMLIFWSAAFKSQQNIAGFNYYNLILYYFLILFARNLILNHPHEDLRKEIYSGKINHFFLQPASLIIFKLAYEVAYKIIRLLYFIPVIALCFHLFLKGKTIDFYLTPLNLIFFMLSCFFSFILIFLIRFLIGINAFWFTEIDWLIGFEELAFLFLGGTLLPIDFLPKILQNIAKFLPYKYLFYQPALGILGKINAQEMLFSLLIQVFWIILILALLKKVYQAGIKIYSAFGG